MTSKKLTPFESSIIENKGTERPFSGLYVHTKTPGTYLCKRCQTPLYQSQDKFASECGWPSFDDAIPGAILRKPDRDGQRIEILCQHCEAHLGHIFEGEQFTTKNIRHCVNSVALDFKPSPVAEAKKIVLASGCFWGTQYFLARLPGVLRTQVGYIGGHVEQPNYKQVCGGKTGHVEAVEVTYDPQRVDLKAILRVFFETHNFSQADGQGPDIGSQYLSKVFYADEAEKTLAAATIQELRDMKYEVATALAPLSPFWVAEDYHQQYYESKGETPYCHRYRRIFKD